MRTETPQTRSERSLGLQFIMLFTMGASTFQLFAFVILAAEIIDTVPMSRATLGILASLATLVGAACSPRAGRLTDRIGPVRATVATLALSALGLATLAISNSVMMLALSAALNGLVQGSSNPATNSLIAERIAPERRGVATGVKQSGVQLATFAAGISLPRLASAIGWRSAIAAFALLILIGAFAAALTLRSTAPTTFSTPHTSGPDASTETRPGLGQQGRLPPLIYAIALYALFAGTAAGALGRFFPLWANEELGLSTATAGDIVSLGGLIGIAARVAAGRIAQRPSRQIPALALLAGVGATYATLLALTTSVGTWVLWPGAALNAIGIGAWNSVAMLTVITVVPRPLAGRASGIVMMGFFGGLSISGPAAGATVDHYGTYQPVWFASIAMMVLALGVILALLATVGNPLSDRLETPKAAKTESA